jgi:hypothetical protein
MEPEVNVLALVKGEDKYIFMFDDANRTETLRMLGRYAADPELSLTWYDAAILSQRIRDAVDAEPAHEEESNRRFSFDSVDDSRPW